MGQKQREMTTVISFVSETAKKGLDAAWNSEIKKSEQRNVKPSRVRNDETFIPRIFETASESEGGKQKVV